MMDLGWVRRVSCDGFGAGQEGVMMNLRWRVRRMSVMDLGWVRRMSCDGFGVGQEGVM